MIRRTALLVSAAAALVAGIVHAVPASAGGVAWSVAIGGPGFAIAAGAPGYWGPRPAYRPYYRAYPPVVYRPALVYPAPVAYTPPLVYAPPVLVPAPYVAPVVVAAPRGPKRHHGPKHVTVVAPYYPY